ncbi:testis-expressed protein 2-like [Montipora foliosa]|uniref:testis-expressed protein 2-like n=1 Tax=Montipora foliosa TaxID=591990 RepID=UPI0035F1E15A
MSAKKPPPRPPLPRLSTTKKGQPTGAPERSFKNVLSSISIRYSNNTRDDSDSEEEISIVRKEKTEDPYEINTQKGKSEENSEENVYNGKVLQEICETAVESTDVSRSEEDRHEEQGESTSETSLKLPHKSLSVPGSGEAPDKIFLTKQRSWPSHSRTEETAESGGIMKFLRGRDRERDKENETNCVPLLDNDVKEEESDAGSLPSKNHVGDSSDRNLKVDGKRSRSPSPFRRLNRDRQVEGSTSSDQEKSKSTSGISLSSLLASVGKDEDHSENNDRISDVDEIESSPDIHSDDPSPSELLSSLNFYPDHFDKKCPDSKMRPPRFAVDKTPQFANFFLCCLLVYIYFLTTWPPFVSGVVFGALSAFFSGCAFLWLFCPEDTAAEQYEKELYEYEHRLARTPKLDYKSLDSGLLLKRHKLEGWMFKSLDYVPDKFDFSRETVPVFASLKGTELTLSHPKSDGTGKKFDPRSVEDQKNITLLFSRHERYELAGSVVSLLPPTMTMKRVWSRKCPICISLEKPSSVSEDLLYNGDGTADEDGFEVVHTMKHQESFDDVGTLYLFARTGREKEEWFNHLCKLLRNTPESSHSNESLSLYPGYMAKLVPEPDSKSSSQSNDIAWVNAMFGRAFWDVWHDKYWTNKVKERFENKLAKMRKPSFIRDITISDLDLGQSLPVITKAHPPVVDKRGTWVDLDVTYSGGLIFTLKGHLNVEGYLSYFLSLGNSEHGELDMAELSRKYEIIDKESLVEEEENECESESPPDSDSDFESPESDLEEFISKADPLGVFCFDDKPVLRQQSESSDSLTQSSFDGDGEVQENKEPRQSGILGDSEEGEDFTKKSSKLNKQKLSASKQSLNEEITEKSFLTPGTTEKKPESVPPSPLKKQLDLSAKHGPKRKIFSVIERLAKSKWVKKAAETGIVKRAAERFSNLPIILSVEVQCVEGTVALNIPPPPTNRLWYGFRGTPLLVVSARPKLGDRQVKLTHATEWIEKKLKQEFRNMFVLPNMEDLPIKIMNSGLEEDFPEW